MHLGSSQQENATGRPVQRLFQLLGVRRQRDGFGESLPFSIGDITAGSESELQAVVIGKKHDVDLPLTIERSNYYANIARRIASGDAPKRAILEIERYLLENEENVWENSWVHFPEKRLSRFARETFEFDLLADKGDRSAGARSDVNRYFYIADGERRIRIPISYLLKLSLAEAIGSQPELPHAVISIGVRALAHFLNDNTSPETFSFYLSTASTERGLGASSAREKSRRFLLCQLLAMYANRRLGLQESGQRAMIYFAPHPPLRQKQLNQAISDSFYRELFMSPCLSGWDDGETKQAYMNLCHQVLSRSQLNAVAKLREAGVVVNNLVVLPNLSNVSLANNGTHLSLGSRRLTEARRDGSSGFGPREEKMVGDLTIKIVEHFLPLFVGTYSAAPYRFDFADLHPERVLGFLPHELANTHLRMIWRRWRNKADLSVFGYRMTPFGPPGIDRTLTSIFRLKGDWVTDSRLIDYPVSLMSTERSPALDGTLGNGDRLKADLADLGVFDKKMSLYLLYRLREFASIGFTGYEGRHYSLFHSLREDFAPAVDLQALITALALKYQANGDYTHADIPDEPFIESERRQIFFGAAIGLPTFFVRRETPNRLLREILKRADHTRASRRYPGYLRVRNIDFRRALLKMLDEDAPDLIEMFGLRTTLDDLRARLDDGEQTSVTQKLLKGILSGSRAASPLGMSADEFNRQAEQYYRNQLRESYLHEALEELVEDLSAMESEYAQQDPESRQALNQLTSESGVSAWVKPRVKDVLNDQISPRDLETLISFTLLSIRREIEAFERISDEHRSCDRTSIY